MFPMLPYLSYYRKLLSDKFPSPTVTDPKSILINTTAPRYKIISKSGDAKNVEAVAVLTLRDTVGILHVAMLTAPCIAPLFEYVFYGEGIDFETWSISEFPVWGGRGYICHRAGTLRRL